MAYFPSHLSVMTWRVKAHQTLVVGVLRNNRSLSNSLPMPLLEEEATHRSCQHGVFLRKFGNILMDKPGKKVCPVLLLPSPIPNCPHALPPCLNLWFLLIHYLNYSLSCFCPSPCPLCFPSSLLSTLADAAGYFPTFLFTKVMLAVSLLCPLECIQKVPNVLGFWSRF